MALHRILRRLGVLLMLLPLTAIVATSSSKSTILDNEPIETIAETICRRLQTIGSRTQIGRVSTINQLVAFFKDLSPSHKLAACGDKYTEALSQLQQVVSQSNNNVCSEQKLTLIERFHHNFISRTCRDKRQQKSGKLVAPKMLVIFFMHYVAKISATCKQSLIQQVNDAPATETGEDLETLDRFLRHFSMKLGASATGLKGYDDITLLWNLVDKLPCLKDEDTQEYLSGPGNRKRLFFRAQSSKVDEIESLQRKCSNELRPVYALSVLPVLRLADLGYHQDKEQFAEELAHLADLRRSISVAQLCEAFLPLKVFKDETLQPGQMVFISREEAQAELSYLEEPYPVQPASTSLDTPEQNSLLNLDTLATVNPEDGHQFAKNIKANIRARELIFHRLLSAMSHQLRDKTKSLAGKLFFSSKVGKSYVKQDLSADELEKEIEMADAELKSLVGGALVRRKRGFFRKAAHVIMKLPMYICRIILWPIVAILGPVYLALDWTIRRLKRFYLRWASEKYCGKYCEYGKM